MEIVFAVIIGIAGLVLGLIVAALLNLRRPATDNLLAALDQQLGERLQQHLTAANQQLVLLANEKLTGERQIINSDLQNKKERIEQLVQQILDDLKNVEQARTRDYTRLATELTSHQQRTEQLALTTDQLRKILSNNQLRGQFGEQVAEDLLKMNGFVRGTDYEFNKAQEGAARPDFAVFLPDGTRINVDAKFPYGNLKSATETEDANQKQQYLTRFTIDVRQKIKEVAERSYINPNEQTVDFVILFIPNEMIFSYIYDKLNDIWQTALEKKVILAGPFSFTAILRMVRQTHVNWRYQKNTRQIIQLIKKFGDEFARYNEEFVKIGDRLNSALQQFEKVNTTRTNQLNRTVDRLKLAEEIEDEPRQLES